MRSSPPIFFVGLIALGQCGWLAGQSVGVPADAKEVNLWSGIAPGSEPGKLPRPDFAETWTGETPKRSVRNALVPSLHVFLPPAGHANGAALVVAPGGGYNTVVIEHEGWVVARRLAADGLTVFVLKYRHWNRDLALRDARRAVRTVRVRAAEWGVDPQRIGLGGFSAGGHLALNAVANAAAEELADAIDRIDPRPDFLMLIYPTPISRLPEGTVVDARFPATFIACAVDDSAEERVLALSAALLKARVRHESHLFATGVHGFGLASEIPGTGEWPNLFVTWLRAQFAPSGGMVDKSLPLEKPSRLLKRTPATKTAPQP